MKTLYLLCLVLLCSTYCQAQFILEHTYDHGSAPKSNQLYIVNFEVSGLRYVKIDRANALILIYDLNHSLVKTITPPAGTIDMSDGYDDVLYCSQHLFNQDGKMEFMIVPTTGANVGKPHWSTYVINEDGLILFYRDNQHPAVHPNWHNQQYPIYNTPGGAKMILSSMTSDSAYVYSLAGLLTNAYSEKEPGPASFDNFFPNPTSESSVIEYNLQADDAPATLKVYDMSGHELQSHPMIGTSGKMEIETMRLLAGTYFYCIQTPNRTMTGKKFVVQR